MVCIKTVSINIVCGYIQYVSLITAGHSCKSHKNCLLVLFYTLYSICKFSLFVAAEETKNLAFAECSLQICEFVLMQLFFKLDKVTQILRFKCTDK